MSLEDKIKVYENKCKILGITPLELDVQGSDVVVTKYNGWEDECIVPSFVTIIGVDAFNECHLKRVIMSSSVKEIRHGAFTNCIYLEEVEATGVVKLGRLSFYGCDSLRTVTLGNKIERIEGGAFKGCVMLKDIHGIDSVKILEDDGFFGCENLNIEKLPNSLESIGKRAFYNVDNSKLEYLGNNIEVKDSAFEYNKIRNIKIENIKGKILRDIMSCGRELNEVIIGKGIKVMNKDALYDAGVKKLYLLDVEVLKENSIYNCTNLTEVVLGSEIRYIDEEAFKYSYNIEKIKIHKKARDRRGVMNMVRNSICRGVGRKIEIEVYED